MLKALYYPGDVDFDSLFIPAIYHEIYYDGIYMDVINVLDNEKKNPIVVDVGANIGITTQYFKEHAKKVYAIEPSSENFEALEANVKKNSWDNVEIFNTAIFNKDGEAFLNKNINNLTMNSISVVYNDDVMDKSEKVKTMKLTTFFEENKIKHVDFMKFDVEGAEDLILPSPDFTEASKIIDNIMIEFHFPTFPELVNLLMKLGYTARRYPCSAVIFNFNK